MRERSLENVVRSNAVFRWVLCNFRCLVISRRFKVYFFNFEMIKVSVSYKRDGTRWKSERKNRTVENCCSERFSNYSQLAVIGWCHIALSIFLFHYFFSITSLNLSNLFNFFVTKDKFIKS